MKLETSNSSESGIALIITLILLSVITFMAVTFLVVSRHASEAVTTVTQQDVAKQAADAAVQQAQARIIAGMLGQLNTNGQPTPNGFNFGLMVSTNFQNPYYDTTQPLGTVNVTNVSYADNAGNLLDYRTDNYRRMLNNLLVLPRPPVFIPTNSNSPPDFRFYLDLNRNGVFDSNNPPIQVVDQFSNLENVVGDPEWIGVLEHPDQPHSRSNQFVARYCFLAQPIGNSLDINYIHNDAKQLDSTMSRDGFLRNQGVGSWEINLAGFLNGLNPNYWGYGFYDTNTGASSITGQAFQDATAILQYRYNGTYMNLASFNGLYGLIATNPPNPLYNLVDYYPSGSLMENAWINPAEALPPYVPPLPLNQNFNLPWSGADNPNHLFTPADFFTAITPPAVTALNQVSNSLSSAGLGPQLAFGDTNFNRYTFYRMLAQMGMESAPEPATKLNLNYVNIGGYSETDFVSWADAPIYYPKGSTNSTTNAALLFFTSAANLLLGTQTNFTIPLPWNGFFTTNLSTSFIPVYPINDYTPSVHRMLQLAANIYDATNPKTNGFDYPSVFQPTFGITNILGVTNIFISGYTEVGTNINASAPYNQRVYSLPDDLSTVVGLLNTGSNVLNIYGIPWVIGAKKYLPNFNQVSMESYTALTRKLEIIKPSLSAARTTWTTNVQYVLGISNGLVVGAWNSYMEPYNRPVLIGGTDTIITVLTNDSGIQLVNNTNTFGTGLTVSNWPGIPVNLSMTTLSNSFIYPFYTSLIPLPAEVYSTNGPVEFIPASTNNPLNANWFETTSGYPLPRFLLNVTNRLRMVMVDQATGRVIDYVQLDGMTDQRDLTSSNELYGNDFWGPGGVWDTNRLHGTSSLGDPLLGIMNQIQASQQDPPYTAPGYPTPVSANDWNTAQIIAEGFSSVDAAADSFSAFYNKNTNVNSYLEMQVPFTPTRSVCVYHTWQVNDPLVHYTLPDLTDLIDVGFTPQTNWLVTNYITASLGQLNKRYMPWGGALNNGNASYDSNLTLLDPLVTDSDAWQFPDTKLPSIGWLGRVHRGTPWQTVYMKSAPADPTLWQNWTGNAALFTNGNNVVFDSTNSMPTNDWAIFDLFTAAPNDNATRGQLSVNQTNYAAWAALLDGVIVLTNDPVNGLTNFAIDPNANAARLYAIIANIANIRSSMAVPVILNGVVTNLPTGVFTRIGDILATPRLSVNSPFLDVGDPSNPTQLNDAAYEWLPQQIMSLLRVGQPRYVIYAYGQSLKPADRSIVPGGQFYGTCTNYQITGEVATRTVVRFEQNPVYTSVNNPGNPLNPTRNPAMPGQIYYTNSILTNHVQTFLPLNGQPPPRAVIESYTVLPPQ